MKKLLYFMLFMLVVGVGLFMYDQKSGKISFLFTNHIIGDTLDSLDGVYVFYNGPVSHVGERNVSKDGYNIGLKYQCVEFVKRYYYEHFNHKMPNAYGNAVDFFNRKLGDGEINVDRDLTQFTNPSKFKPQKGDLIVMDGTGGNPYGHVAIVSEVTENSVEIIQQNPGPMAHSRVSFDLNQTENKRYKIKNERILGWLRTTLIR